MEWRIVPDYPMYEISTSGLVRNRKRKIIKQQISMFGYPRVMLSNKEGPKRQAVHRLVAKAFISESDPLKTQVNHKDGNKQNNNVDNLEWVTPSENMLHRHYVLNKANRAVKCVETGEEYMTIKEAARVNNSYGPNIIRACKNNTTAVGYHWKYI